MSDEAYVPSHHLEGKDSHNVVTFTIEDITKQNIAEEGHIYEETTVIGVRFVYKPDTDVKPRDGVSVKYLKIKNRNGRVITVVSDLDLKLVNDEFVGEPPDLLNFNVGTDFPTSITLDRVGNTVNGGYVDVWFYF